MEKFMVMEDETSKSTISSKPSTLIVEGLEAVSFAPIAWNNWKTEILWEKNQILCLKEMHP